MKPVLLQISDIRKGKPFDIDYKNTNRYFLVANEENGSKTAYCFTSPIYNIHTRKMVDMKFQKIGSTVSAVGSNANIEISDNVRIENAEGYCVMNINGFIKQISESEVKCGNDIITPTTNGIVYKHFVADNSEFVFDLEVSRKPIDIRFNNKYLSFMSDKFRPFVTISCIGAADDAEKIISPASITYQNLSDSSFRVKINSSCDSCSWIMFEVNMYEPKLVQDTTVESNNPKSNNAFGGTAFIGNTVQFGEQWLYSKIDYSKLSQLMDKRVNKAILHIPRLSDSFVELSAYKVSARFCSFGSNWDNKIRASVPISDTLINDNYQSLDITDLLIDSYSGYIIRSEGLILKSKIKASGFSALATGDSCYMPQIFEINFN